MFAIDIANQQTVVPVDERRLKSAVRAVLKGEGLASAKVSLAVVDDATIQQLNVRYLAHDYATDVLSFLLDEEDDYREGEVVVSAETALREAPSYGWAAADELLLYVLHGTLHLLGYDDQAREDRAAMREKERIYLRRLGYRSSHAAGGDEKPDSRSSKRRAPRRGGT